LIEILYKRFSTQRKMRIIASSLALIFLTFTACGQKSEKKASPSASKKMSNTNVEVATLGAGCFWCVEGVFQELKGVEKVVSGYTGGHKQNPTYKEVCDGTTGHAEVAQITFDPSVVSFREILEVFFLVHDPTTRNRQGNDVGTQYRSAIYFHNAAQKEISESVIKELNASGAWEKPIVTEVTAFEKFWPAEDYHQNYYKLNSEQPYCQYVVRPKLEKFRKVFKEKLK
jgi:peptide-methionine (S)-S-oxide reductase